MRRHSLGSLPWTQLRTFDLEAKTLNFVGNVSGWWRVHGWRRRMAATRSPPPTQEARSSLLLRTIEFMYGCLCEHQWSYSSSMETFQWLTALKSPSPSCCDLLMDPQECLTATASPAVVGQDSSEGISSLEEGVPLTWRWSNFTAETVTLVCHWRFPAIE